jgi:hypothetical protein
LRATAKGRRARSFHSCVESPAGWLASSIPAKQGVRLEPLEKIVAKYLLQQVFYQQFSHLHSIERGAFAYVI